METLYRVTYENGHGDKEFLYRYQDGVTKLLAHIFNTPGLDLVSVTVEGSVG